MRDKISMTLAGAAAVLLAYNLRQMFLTLPDEAMQGAIYRILFFHAPAAIVGMIGYFVALVFSILYLSSGKFRYDSLAASIVEVSLVFSVVNIVTGSIWARIIWGIWWTWDYRLTSALVCVLIFAGYLMLRRAIEEPSQRARLSAALCIFGCVDVGIFPPSRMVHGEPRMKVSEANMRGPVPVIHQELALVRQEAIEVGPQAADPPCEIVGQCTVGCAAELPAGGVYENSSSAPNNVSRNLERSFSLPISATPVATVPSTNTRPAMVML